MRPRPGPLSAIRPRAALLFALLLGAGLCPGPAYSQQAARPGSPAPASAHHAQAQPSPGVPVRYVAATLQDVPVLASGLGTVQAWQSVTVRPQVSGIIQALPFREGQEVKPGELLAVIDPRPYAAIYAQALAHKASDLATLANDRTNLGRDRSLASSQFASRQQVDNDQAGVASLQAAIQGDDATIEAAALNLSFCRIASPIQGVAGLRLVDVGNLVQSGSQGTSPGIVTIAQVHPIAVLFTLPEGQLPAVQAALRAGPVPVEASSQDGSRSLGRGELVTPSNTIDSTTGTITLKARFANADDRLWPGQFVNAAVQLSVDRSAVTVPTPALQRGTGGPFVYVIGAGDHVALRQVTLGYADPKRTVIASGLAAGERVVVAGQSRLDRGTLVDPRPAGQTPDAASGQNTAAG